MENDLKSVIAVGRHWARSKNRELLVRKKPDGMSDDEIRFIKRQLRIYSAIMYALGIVAGYVIRMIVCL